MTNQEQEATNHMLFEKVRELEVENAELRAQNLRYRIASDRCPVAKDAARSPKQNTARPQVHELKTWPEYFEAVFDGRKKFEYRNASDRCFEVGDALLLREYDPWTKVYSGRQISVSVCYILRLGDYVVMSIATEAAKEKP